MDKKHLLIVGVVFITLGCTTAGQDKLESYLDNPGKVMIDPHYTDYADKKTSLESEYLAKKITYAEYLEGRKELDKEYTREVQHRENVLSGQ